MTQGKEYYLVKTTYEPHGKLEVKHYDNEAEVNTFSLSQNKNIFMSLIDEVKCIFYNLKWFTDCYFLFNCIVYLWFHQVHVISGSPIKKLSNMVAGDEQSEDGEKISNDTKKMRINDSTR